MPMVTGGCESTGSTASLSGAIESYDAGQFGIAMQESVEVGGDSFGDRRRQAKYIEGMAAYRLDDTSRAGACFREASTAHDDDTAGRAHAMLGVIRLDQDRFGEAEDHFAQASTRLADPRAQDQARQHADYAKYLAGSPTAAVLASRSAASSRRSVVRSSDPALNAGSFCLQVGAFRERERADQASRAANQLARDSGLGRPRVVLNTDSRGKNWYYVQLGDFRTRAAASQARQRIGRLELLVTQARF